MLIVRFVEFYKDKFYRRTGHEDYFVSPPGTIRKKGSIPEQAAEYSKLIPEPFPVSSSRALILSEVILNFRNT